MTNPGFNAYMALQTQTSISLDDNNTPQGAYKCFNSQELEKLSADTGQTYFGGHEFYGNSTHGMTLNTNQTPLQWLGNENKVGVIIEEVFLDSNWVTCEKCFSSISCMTSLTRM